MQTKNLFKKERVALGTAQFGLDYGISNKEGVMSKSQIKNVLDYASSSGITTLDTAYSYGNSEEILGHFDMGKWNIVSKFPSFNSDQEKVSDYLNRSLDRLNIKSFYAYLAHRAQVFIETPSVWEDLVSLKNNGKVERIGYSIYKPKELEVLLDKKFVPDLIQIPYNIADRRFEPYFRELKNRNIEIHVRSCFLQGLFFMNPSSLTDFFDEFTPYFNVLNQFYPSLTKRAAALLKFCLNNKYVDKVVFGVNNLTQLEKNLNGLSRKMELYNFKEIKIPKEHALLPYNWPS